jgi:DNA-binding CsgD family transcriptional regulator
MKLSITIVVSIIIINRFTVKYLKKNIFNRLDFSRCLYKIVPKNGGFRPS